MSAYRKNHVKRDPESGRYAVRSGFDDEDTAMEHLAWTVLGGEQVGTRKAKTPEVDAWDDLYIPEAPK